MLNLNDPRLIELTEAANRRLAEIHDAFGWVLPNKVNPGVVAVIVDLVDAQPDAVKPPKAVVNFVPASNPPPAATQPQPAPVVDAQPAAQPEPTARVSTRIANAELLDQAKAVIRRIAVDGQMPTMAEFNERKPDDMPTANHITQKTFVRWGDLADELNLQSSKGRRKKAGHRKPRQTGVQHRKPPVESTRQSKAQPPVDPPRHHTDDAADLDPAARRQQLEDIIFHLRDMAVDGKLPLAETWNERKPEHLPDSKAIMLRWGLLKWDELAGYTHLETGHKRRAGATDADFRRSEPGD